MLGNQDITDSERKVCEEKAKVAIDTFRSMFQDRLQDNFLLQEAEDTVVTTFTGWAEEMIPAISEVGEQGSHRHVLDDIAKCSEELKRLTSDGGSGEPALWPFIQKIKFVPTHQDSRR